MGRYIVWALAVMWMQGCVAEARAESPTLETERVVVFKDGHALVIKQARAVADAHGTFSTDQVPEGAVLGTFWAWAEHGPVVKAMRAEWIEQEVDKEERGECSDPAAILATNPGKQVTVHLESSSLTGTVLALPVAARAEGAPSPSTRSSVFEAASVPPALPPGSLAVLKVPERGTVVIAGKDIRRVEGPELSLECKRTVRVTERRKRLSLDFGEGAAGKSVSVRLIYFTPGLRWIPTYQLELQEGGKGMLALQAELLNELEDFRGAAVDLVVGVPNFRFREVSSPLSLEGVVRNTLEQAAPSLMGSSNSLSNAVFSQRASEWRGNEEAESTAPRIPDFGGSGESTDFFVHHLAALSLPKGSRVIVPLWKEEVPTRDVYTLDVRVNRSANATDTIQYGTAGGAMGNSSPLHLSRGEVWHQLELKNDTKHPLTTGPVLVMRGQVPQSQELLTYTPRGGSTRVPLTIATDVRSFHEEVELERKQDALKIDRGDFTLIRKKGTLTVENSRGGQTPMRIHLSTGGKVEQVSDKGQVKVDDFDSEDWGDSRLTAVNSHSEVDWSLTLAPGEQRTLTYEIGFWR